MADETLKSLEIEEMKQNIAFQKETHERDVKQIIESHKEDMRQNKASFDSDMEQRKQVFDHEAVMNPLTVKEMQQSVVRDHLETLYKVKTVASDDKALLKIVNTKIKEMVEALNADITKG
jgi:hypothetical protein